MAKSKHNRKGKTRSHFRSRPAVGRSQGLDQSYRHLKLFNIEIHQEQLDDDQSDTRTSDTREPASGVG